MDDPTYLLYFPGGEDATATEAEPPTFWSDALSYQAPASLLPAAAIGVQQGQRLELM